MALAIVLILLGVLTVAVSRQRRGSERLADSRAAIRLAEENDHRDANRRHARRPRRKEQKSKFARRRRRRGSKCRVARLGFDVHVTYGNGRSSSLSGLVRADAAKGAVK
jgi:hypothetical protein